MPPSLPSPQVEGPEDETPFSALFWRSGVVGLLYYAAAFLLLWHHFLPVQLAFWAAYTSRLTTRVCATTTHSSVIAAALRAVHGTLAAGAHWVMAAHGAVGLVEHSGGSSSSAVAAAAAGFAKPASSFLSTGGGWSSLTATAAAAVGRMAGDSSSSMASGVCLQGPCPTSIPAVSLLGPVLDCPYTVWGLQTIVGLLLPCFFVYVMESRARRQWAKSQFLAIAGASSRRQSSSGAMPRNASGTSSGSGGGGAFLSNGGRALSLSRAASEGWGGEAGDVWGSPAGPAAAADVALGPATPLYCQLYCVAVAGVGVWAVLGWLQRQGLVGPGAAGV